MYLPRKGLQGGKTMGLMIKLSLKSISAKPLRLLLLVICIIFASFTALLAVDMRNNITSLMNGYKMDMLGSMDILAYNSSSETVEGLEEIAALKKTGMGSAIQYEYDTDPSGYECTGVRHYSNRHTFGH